MIEITSLCGQICLGKQGENLARVVYFDEPAMWKETFGEGKCELVHQRSGDEAPYPVVLNVEGDKVSWIITNADTAIIGEGKCELHYIVDNVVVKSKIWTTSVLQSLGDATGEPPEPQKAWVDQVLDAAKEVEENAQKVENATIHQPFIGENKNWFVWNIETQEYTDTGIIAEGKKGEQGIQGIQGEKGEKGDKGDKGVDGKDSDISLSYAHNTFANALKGTAGGEIIGMHDVSPIEHEMSVKVSGVDDLTSVKVMKLGKNLFSYGKATLDNGQIIEYLENGVRAIGNKGTSPGTNSWDNGWVNFNNSKHIFLKKGYNVRVSADITWLNIDNYLQNKTFGIHLYGETDVLGYHKNYPTAENLNKTFRIGMQYEIPKSGYYYPIFTLDSCEMKIENIQVSFGEDDIYEPYIQPTEYTPDADGVVSGVTSLYPSTTLMTDTDGALIDATYNKDINKAFEEIKNVILSLGGNI